MIRLLLLALLLLLVAPRADARAPAGGTEFAAIAFHDVVDDRARLTDDAVTAQSLADFFDWLKADGWTPVSLDAIAAAGQGGPPLPPKAILLSFDDGYASFHDRVWPLLLAFRYPAVLALVTSWMEVPPGGMVDYGGTLVPRSRFVTWDQVRAMQASGLVEIASHSHDLHRVMPSTPQGNSAPSARTWSWDAVTGQREDDAAHRARIGADLARSHAAIARETGKAPRALVWPFGRFSGPALAAAREAGFGYAFTLEPEMGDARQPMTLHRYYPTQDPSLGVLAWNLGFPTPRAETMRLACVDIAPLASADPAESDARLGALVEAVRALAPNAVVLDIAPSPGADNVLAAAWLPTPGLPLAADIFGRAARQLQTRAGVQIYARLPLGAATRALGAGGAASLLADVVRVAPLDGILLEGLETPGATAPLVPPSLADTRAARSAAPGDATAALFAAATALDPRLRLITIGPGGPPPPVDRRIATDEPAVPALGAAGWLDPAHAGRAVVPVPAGSASATRRFVHRAQAAGATAFHACPVAPADMPSLAPILSAASFPYRP